MNILDLTSSQIDSSKALCTIIDAYNLAIITLSKEEFPTYDWLYYQSKPNYRNIYGFIVNRKNDILKLSGFNAELVKNVALKNIQYLKGQLEKGIQSRRSS